MQDLIKKLTDVYSPSGYEEAIREIIQAEVTPHVDSVEVDALGNLHAVKNGDGSGQTIMLAAHMDEIGLMVTEVDKEGFIRFTNLGGLFPMNLAGSRVVFKNGTTGMINIEDAFTRPAIKNGFSNVYIDVGVLNREDCPVKVGDVAAFVGPAVVMGNRVMAKSMDDRIGCVVQIETLKRLQDTPHNVHFVFTVQEEVGVRGARTSAFKVTPDIAIAIDVTPAGGMPGETDFSVKMGQGPAIKVMDRGNISHPAVKDWMIDVAEANEIPYQLEVLTAGGTDAAGMQLARAGAAAGCVSIPTRHVHTPSEIVDLNDVENVVKLLVALLSGSAPESLRNL